MNVNSNFITFFLDKKIILDEIDRSDDESKFTSTYCVKGFPKKRANKKRIQFIHQFKKNDDASKNTPPPPKKIRDDGRSPRVCKTNKIKTSKKFFI